MRGVSNTWVAIQTYYACYHVTQALVVAKGQPRPTSHPKTQKMFVDMWITPSRDLVRWSLGAIHGGYANLPIGHVVDESFNRWATLDSKAATRLTPEDHSAVESGARAFSMLDYLFRLRITAQYEDSTLFSEGLRHQDSLSVYQRRVAPFAVTALQWR